MTKPVVSGPWIELRGEEAHAAYLANARQHIGVLCGRLSEAWLFYGAQGVPPRFEVLRLLYDTIHAQCLSAVSMRPPFFFSKRVFVNGGLEVSEVYCDIPNEYTCENPLADLKRDAEHWGQQCKIIPLTAGEALYRG